MACLSLRAHTLLQTLYPLLFLMRSSASFILINVNSSISFFIYYTLPMQESNLRRCEVGKASVDDSRNNDCIRLPYSGLVGSRLSRVLIFYRAGQTGFEPASCSTLVGWDCHSPITKHCPFASYTSMITMSGATPLIASICSSITLFLYSSMASFAPAETKERETSRPSTSA